MPTRPPSASRPMPNRRASKMPNLALFLALTLSGILAQGHSWEGRPGQCSYVPRELLPSGSTSTRYTSPGQTFVPTAHRPALPSWVHVTSVTIRSAVRTSHLTVWPGETLSNTRVCPDPSRTITFSNGEELLFRIANDETPLSNRTNEWSERLKASTARLITIAAMTKVLRIFIPLSQ